MTLYPQSTYRMCPVTADVWRRFAEAEPDVDFTRIYPFVEGERG